MSAPIKKKQFHLIARAIREAVSLGNYNAEKIAATLKVSRSTVSNVKRAKTWNGYLAIKASRQTSRKTSAVETELAENIEHLETEEDRLQAALDELAKRPTRSEFNDRIQMVDDRIDLLWNIYRGLLNDPLFRLLFGRKIAHIIERMNEQDAKEASQ